MSALSLFTCNGCTWKGDSAADCSEDVASGHVGPTTDLECRKTYLSKLADLEIVAASGLEGPTTDLERRKTYLSELADLEIVAASGLEGPTTDLEVLS